MANRLSALSLLIAIIAFGCGKKHDDNHHHDEHSSAKKEWKEMDAFHMIMAEAFHPYKDSANLQPARDNAQALVSSAKEWKASEVPAGVDKDGIENKLNKLVAASEEFSKQVDGGADDTIAAKLTELHDIFHELQNDFYAGASEGHDHEHEHDHQ
jgi:hypothetical protein